MSLNSDLTFTKYPAQWSHLILIWMFFHDWYIKLLYLFAWHQLESRACGWYVKGCGISEKLGVQNGLVIIFLCLSSPLPTIFGLPAFSAFACWRKLLSLLSVLTLTSPAVFGRQRRQSFAIPNNKTNRLQTPVSSYQRGQKGPSSVGTLIYWSFWNLSVLSMQSDWNCLRVKVWQSKM